MATHKQEHRPEADPVDLNEVPPEGLEPDLTPAPGTLPSTPAPTQSQSQSQGPGQTQSQSQTQAKDELGFDPDSPDLADPQVDPIGKAKIPDDAPGMQVKKRVNDDEYPPYNKD
jgi:hypothetical protein